MGLGRIKLIFQILVDLILKISLQLHNETGILLFVTPTHMTSFMQQVLIMLLVEVAYHFYMGQQQMR